MSKEESIVVNLNIVKFLMTANNSLNIYIKELSLVSENILRKSKYHSFKLSWIIISR